MTPIKRWSASTIIDFFVKNPTSKIEITTADMNSWLMNSENRIAVPPSVYSVSFFKIRNGIWEAKLQFEQPLREKKLRFK